MLVFLFIGDLKFPWHLNFFGETISAKIQIFEKTKRKRILGKKKLENLCLFGWRVFWIISSCLYNSWYWLGGAHGRFFVWTLWLMVYDLIHNSLIFKLWVMEIGCMQFWVIWSCFHHSSSKIGGTHRKHFVWTHHSYLVIQFWWFHHSKKWVMRRENENRFHLFSSLKI